MRSALFVSDIHIESMQDPKAVKFLAYLQGLSATNCSHLFLLGDIFDFWIADHEHFVKRYEPLLAELGRLKSVGIEVHYFEGNHDLHLKEFFQRELGVQIHEGPQYFNLYDKKLRIEHGDQMDPEDKGYLFLRWLLRTPLMRWLSFQLPGFAVAKIGEASSSASRNYTSEIKKISQDRARQKIRLHAEKSYTDEAFDLIVSGHMHVRDNITLTSGAKSWNLGTWLEEPGYLLLNEKSLQWVSLK